MRLIDTETGMFIETNEPQPYAILSHTWDDQGEQSYQEVREIQRSFASRRGVRTLSDFLVQEEYDTESPCFFHTTPLQHRPRSWRSMFSSSYRPYRCMCLRDSVVQRRSIADTGVGITPTRRPQARG